MDVKWIKLSTALPDSRKLKMIRSMPDGNSIALFWVYLLCLAGQTNDGGCVYFTQDIPYSDEMLATQFGFDVSLVRVALKTFERFGMIYIVDDVLHVTSWEKYQSSDKLDQIRESTRKRVAAYRERKAIAECNVTRNVTVTRSNATDIDIDKDIELHTKVCNRRFTKPTISDISNYCKEQGISIDEQSFIDFYESKGWRVGNSPMKDWKAAVRNWARKDAERAPATRKRMGSHAGYAQTPFPEGAIEFVDLDHDREK